MNDEDVHLLCERVERLQRTVDKLADWAGIGLAELWEPGGDYELLKEGDMD